MIEGLKNAIIIDGVVHELVDVDPGTDDCEICSLREKCHDELGTFCLGLFDDAVYKRFKERTDL
jgi:hypothetical protein